MDPSQAPEVVSVPNPAPKYYEATTSYNNHNQITSAERNETSKKTRHICGLRPSTFWLALMLAAVIIAGAVGGGVGGSMAVAKAKRAR